MDPEIRMVVLQWSGDMMIVGLAPSGEKVVSIRGLKHQSSYIYLRRGIVRELLGGWASLKRVVLYKSGQAVQKQIADGSLQMPIGDLEHVVAKVVVNSGWLRWRLCECEPPPDYIRRVTVWTHPRRRVRQQWFFICEDCQRRDPGHYFMSSMNVNAEGNASTAESSFGYSSGSEAREDA